MLRSWRYTAITKRSSYRSAPSEPDPWLDPDKLPYEGQKVLGIVAAVNESGERLGIHINLEPGLVCYYNCAKNKYTSYSKGDRVLIKVRKVNSQKRLILANIIEQRKARCTSAI